MKGNKSILILLLILLVVLVPGFAVSAQDASYHQLILLSTTDLHQYILPYNYMADTPNENIGLSKVFTLIQQARIEYNNTMLFSSGDDIQGSLLGDMEADVDPLTGHEFQAIIKAMNAIGYDAAVVGNHEVSDYGLNFFEQAMSNSVFPWLSVNIKMADNTDEFYVKPYTVIQHNVDGIPIDVGVIGVTPPQIMEWGRSHLHGKVIAKDSVPQVEKYLPILREKSDIVVVLSHGGISTDPIDSRNAREDACYYLAQIEGIDAILMGHQHRHFPGDFDGIEGVDNEKGLIHGVPAVMAGNWGNSLGVVEINLAYHNGEWEVLDGQSHIRLVDETVPSNPWIEEIVKDRHEATIEYVRTPIGQTEIEIASYFSRIKDSAVTQLVNNVQILYAQQYFQGTEYEDLPIISVMAPFIAGRHGPHYFTHVADDVNIGDVTDIYIFPNTVYVLKLNGQQVIDWLEYSGRNFNQIDPELTEPQHLINYTVMGYHFDVLEGINYIYDVTKPVGERVETATLNGKPLTADMDFLVVTNNFRASGGGAFPHAEEKNWVLPSTDVSREQVISYIYQEKVINPTPSQNWGIKPIATKGPIYYRSSPDAEGYLVRNEIPGIKYIKTDEDGWGIFEIDLLNLYKTQ